MQKNWDESVTQADESNHTGSDQREPGLHRTWHLSYGPDLTHGQMNKYVHEWTLMGVIKINVCVEAGSPVLHGKA